MSPVTPAIFVALLLLALGAIVGLAVASQRRRERAKSESFQRLAAELGLAYEPKGGKDFRDAWTVLPQIPRQGEVHHLMYGEIDGAPVTFFRHRYVVSTGQATSVVVHWVFSTEVASWPEIHIKRRGALRRMLGGRSANASEDDLFNRAWVVKSDDRAFARAFLNERVRGVLGESVRDSRRKIRESWHVVGGKLCCVTRVTADESIIRRQAHRLLTMRAAASGERGSEASGAVRQLIGSEA